MNEQVTQMELNQQEIDAISDKLISGLDIQDRTYLLRSYPKCFIGSEAVSYLIKEGIVTNEVDAVALGNVLLKANVFKHVTRDHTFKNEYLFYRFTAHEDDKGSVPKNASGSSVSWADFLQRGFDREDSMNFQPTLPRDRVPTDPNSFHADQAAEKLEVSPLDAHNVRLLDNVHPVQWNDPKVADKYNMVVIGAGAGGLVTAAGSAGVGAKVAIIEKNLMGGDCLNVGCVPSKALLRAAKAVHQVRTASEFGVTINGTISVNFGAIMERMRKIRADISKNDSVHRFTKELGIDVFMGEGKFTGPNTVEVNGQTLHFAKACIATGGSAAVPNIPGLKDVPYYTNATVFNLVDLPPRIAVIGAGPIGCELAQAFQRFGSQVNVLVRSDRILPKEDPEAAQIVHRSMAKDGVNFVFKTDIAEAKLARSKEQREEKDCKFPEISLMLTVDGKPQRLDVDAIIVAAGRAPNVKNVGLEAAGVEYDLVSGVKVNDHLQSSQKHIFAVGDVCCKYQFTHVADWTARTVIRNALFFGSSKMSSLIIPWATYTDPEIAHVGLYEADCKERGIPYRVFQKEFADVDRCLTDGEAEGFVKVLCKENSDEIIGATIVGPHAGDLISELTLALQYKVGLSRIATVIHPYPTTADAIRGCGDQFNRTRLTTFVKGLFRNLMAFQRR